MSRSQVDYVFPKEILGLVAKSSSFASEKFPVNNNENLSISLHSIGSIGLSAVAKIQGSHDDSMWFDLLSTDATITGDDDVLWTLSELKSLMYVRVYVTFTSGSALFNIIARGT